MSWTQQQCDDLKRLWAEGYSAADIAALIGEHSRNAVIGKVHRLGLASRISGQNPKKHREHRERKSERVPKLNVGKVKSLVAPPPHRPPIEFDGFPITLFELSNWTCRWPVSDDVCNMFYCGEPQADLAKGRPYCERHTAIAFPPRSRP